MVNGEWGMVNGELETIYVYLPQSLRAKRGNPIQRRYTMRLLHPSRVRNDRRAIIAAYEFVSLL